MWHKYAHGPAPRLIAHTMEPVRCAHGMRVLPDSDFATAGTLSQLLVPGGFAAFDEMKNVDLLGFVRGHSVAGASILSVCSGAFILLAAGLLEGRRASTNWKVIGRLRDAGVEVVEERYTHDGSVWTSGGVSAGMDMMLAYIANDAGTDAASTVQLHAEYYPEARLWGEARAAQPMPAYVQRI